jgi:hypothetical protein
MGFEHVKRGRSRAVAGSEKKPCKLRQSDARQQQKLCVGRTRRPLDDQVFRAETLKESAAVERSNGSVEVLPSADPP